MRGPLLGTPMLWETQWFPPPSPHSQRAFVWVYPGNSRAFLCQGLRQGQLCQLRDTMGTTKGLWGSFLFMLVMSLHGCLPSESTWGFEKARPKARQPLNKQKTCCSNKELGMGAEQPKRAPGCHLSVAPTLTCVFTIPWDKYHQWLIGAVENFS